MRYPGELLAKVCETGVHYGADKRVEFSNHLSRVDFDQHHLCERERVECVSVHTHTCIRIYIYIRMGGLIRTQYICMYV